MLVLSITLLAQASQPAALSVLSDNREPASGEIVVTAKRDKCFLEYAKRSVSMGELEALSSTWSLGTPVRVIEPLGASLKCEFQIMTLLSKHGEHLAHFVSRADDETPDPTIKHSVSPSEQFAPSATSRAESSRTLPSPPPMLSSDIISDPANTITRRPRNQSQTIRPTNTLQSGVVILRCLMDDPARPYPLDIEVNEAKGTVTPSRPDTGGGSEMRAVFMPAAVRFGPFVIYRTTLRIERKNGSSVDTRRPITSVVSGQCRLLKNIQRAF